jgi:hypothetical protein
MIEKHEWRGNEEESSHFEQNKCVIVLYVFLCLSLLLQFTLFDFPCMMLAGCLVTGGLIDPVLDGTGRDA